jgi:hypothetical protein
MKYKYILCIEYYKNFIIIKGDIMKYKSILSLIVISTSLMANAGGFLTGDDLIAKMQDKSQAALAVGYIVGVFDTGNGRIFCPPNGTTVKQVAEVVVNTLLAYPYERGYPANDIVTFALYTAFPCEEKKTKKDNLNAGYN